MKTNNIKEIREKQGMTQQDVADKVGTHWQRVSEWERGIKFPNGRNMIKIAKALQSNVDEVFVKGCGNAK